MSKQRLLVIIPLLFLGLWLFRDRVATKPAPAPSPIPTPSPAPTPTPKPLTFSQLNALYGPCVYLPTLMYHHVQPPEKAKEFKQTALSVDTGVFRGQMQYLREKSYTVVTLSDLVNFFNQGTAIPKKAVLITFDDGYADFYSDAFPVLKEFGYKATVFLATGLTNNYGYLNWGEIGEAAGWGVTFGNHTWSHKNVKQDNSVVEKEITLADSQLAERGLNLLKAFAYPYGFTSSYSQSVLVKLGYQLAFTTKPGSTLCKQLRYELPRIRVGNSALGNYGL